VLRLAAAAELAIRGVKVLAERYGNRPVPLDAICAEQKLPKQYLVKLFSLLVKADLITPVRGKHGGYMLARAPKEISLLEVIEAVEGTLALNFCQHDPPKCELVDCPLREVWSRLQETVRETLDSVTLADAIAHRKG